MRVTGLAIFLCMSFAVVSARATDQCQHIQKAGDLLACYNGAAPLQTPVRPKRSETSIAKDKPAGSEAAMTTDKAAAKTPTDPKEKYVDVLAIENSKLGAKMKTICRGC